MPTLHVIEPHPHASIAGLVASGSLAAGDRLIMVGETAGQSNAEAFGLRVDAVVSPTLGVTSSAGRRLESRVRAWAAHGWACERVVPWSGGAFEACVRLDDLVKGNPELAQVSGAFALGQRFADVKPAVAGAGRRRTVAVLADPVSASELTPYVQVLAMADKAGADVRVLAPRGCADQSRGCRLFRECGLSVEFVLTGEPLWTLGFDVGLSILQVDGVDSTAHWASEFWRGACERAGIAFVAARTPGERGPSMRADLGRRLVGAIEGESGVTSG